MTSYLVSLPGVCSADDYPPTLRSDAEKWALPFAILILFVWAAGLVIGFVPALILLTLLGFGTSVMGVARPVIGMFGVGVLCSIDNLIRVYLMSGGLFCWNTLNYLLIVVALFGIPCLLRIRSLPVRILQLFVLLLGFGIVYSPNHYVGALHLLSLVSVFGLLVYVDRATHDRHVWYWMGVVNGCSGAVGGLVYWQQYDRLPYIDPNAWAYFPLTAIFSICLAIASTAARQRGQWLLWLLAALNLLWVFLSGSRGSIVVGVCCAIYLVSSIRGVFRRVVWIGTLGLVGFAIAGAFTDRLDLATARVNYLLNTDKSLRSRTSGRSELMMVGWRMYLDHPLGIGTGGFQTAFAEFDDRPGLNFRRGYQMAAHSAWVKTLVENGSAGVILLAAYLSSFLVLGWQTRHRGALSLGCLVTISLATAFLTTEFQNMGLWWLAAGTTILLCRRTCDCNATTERALT